MFVDLRLMLANIVGSWSKHTRMLLMSYHSKSSPK